MTVRVRRSVGRGAAVAAVLCLGGALAACSSSSGGSGGLSAGGNPTASVTPSAPVTTATPPPTPTATVTVTTAPPTAASAGCKKADLQVTVGGSDAATGHRRVVVVFTNTGTRTCTMHGYPGVAALDASGAQVAQAARSLHGFMGGVTGTRAPTVSLTPGKSASAVVEALGFTSDGSPCIAYAGLLVTAPDDTVSTHVAWGNDGCARLQVHPVVPGASGDAG